jgi:hypothetical protein
MATPIEIFQTKVTTAADALALINGVFQWAFGPTPPSITFPFLNWADTGTNSWYQRNADDNAWIFKGALDSAFAPMDGWINGLNSVYVSSVSIKIESMDVRDRIQQGTKIRYKQGGEYKYDFVSEVSFATDSILTLMGGSTVEDETITDFAYSNIATPVGWPFGVDYIEGKNATGTWKKWVNGNQECEGRYVFTNIDVSVAYGSMYRSNLFEGLTLPIEFLSVDICLLDIQQVSSALSWLAIGASAPTSIYSQSFHIVRATSGTLSEIVIGLKAKGRWKE